jgi:hypothetical protein
MTRTCPSCHVTFDDALCLTYCPHSQFIEGSNAARKDRAFSFSGKTLRFKDSFLKVDSPLKDQRLRLQSIDWCGYMTVVGLPGSYSPDVFEVVAE